ncbi:histidine kinase-like ATPase, partial [Suillus plorans]
VEVNQRALVDKVLARYPEEFTVFRELLQNADDARAKKVLIEFQTKDYATHSAGANGKTNGINGTTDFPDLVTMKLYKWVVRNNGDYFEDKDWGRLTKIADGNPDEQKIGAFGVGFYSIFGITDSPQVFSGGKRQALSLTRSTMPIGTPDSEWTSIEMQLKEDMQVPVPKPFDLARFLATTMTFMSCVENTHVFFNDKIFMKIAKSRQVPSSIRVPKDMIPRSKEDTMHIKGLSVVSGLHVVFSAREAY